MKYFLGKRDIFIQFVKFNIIGIVNTIITYLLFSCVFYSTGNYFISLVADYIFGIIFSFYMNKNITFKVLGPTSIKMAVRMIFSYIFVFILNLLLLKILIDLLMVNVYISQMIALIVIMLAGFIVQKLYVFNLNHVNHKKDHINVL